MALGRTEALASHCYYNKSYNKKVIQIMAQEFNLKKLIQKVSSQLPQIQVRSLNNIYTKIAHQIVSVQALLQYPQLPGVLMRWINDNKKKSDTLLKVIYLLASFTKLDKGLLLLRQYECLEFCEEFKIYLIQNQRAVDAFTQQLDAIIRSLLPLGRANESHVIAIQDTEPTNQINSKATKQSNTQNKNKANKIQVKQVLKFRCQNIPLSQAQDKTIFEMIMKMKYSNKGNAFATLMQIGRFVSHYSDYAFRSKSDLVTHLCQISLANIFPQICMSIVADIMKGLINSQNATHSQQNNQIISLAYAKSTPIQIVQLQIGLPLKIFQLPQSFVVIKQLVGMLRQKSKYQPLQYLLAINYKYSPQLLLQILAQLKQKQAVDNMNLYIKTIQQYSHKFPKKADDFINVLPQQVWRKAQSLVSVYDSSQKKLSFRHIENYLDPRQFELTKNLHVMMEILQNLKKAIIGVQLCAKQSVRFYLDVTLTLAISVSRQDPLMSYYGQAQQLFMKLTSHSNKQVAIQAYSQLLQGIKNVKSIINYPGVSVRRHEVIQIIFTTPQFTSKMLQCSLDMSQTLNIMLNIVLTLMERNQTKIFTTYIPILFALCHHPNQHISTLANRILSSMPKHSSKYVIMYDLFSTDTNIRKNILMQLLNKQEIGNDIVQKISMGHFINKKKQLKISSQSIQNYLNIVLNPNLDIYIKDSAINQFIDCLERAEGSQLPDLVQAQIVLVQQIKQVSKKQLITNLEQKLITLHFILSQKKQSLESVLSWQILGILLHKVKSQSCLAYILTTLYTKLFQSPFSNQINTKNWAMMHFPHLQIVKMNIQQPLRVHSQQINQQKAQRKQTIAKNTTKQNIKNKDNFDNKYVQWVAQVCIADDLSEERIESLQQQVVNSVTTTDIAKLSKLQFIVANSTIKILKPAFKIILQYIRTNPAAIDIANLLSTFISHSDDRHEFILNTNNLQFLLISLNDKSISNQQVNKMMKLVQDNISMCQIYHTLAKEKAVKFSSFNQYTGLQLIQSIINTIRNNISQAKNKQLALILLNRIIQSQFKIQQHIITISTLLNTYLMESKISTLEFVVALNCYSGLLVYHYNEDFIFSRQTIYLIQQLCLFIFNSNNHVQDVIVILTACFSFINDLLRSQAVHHNKQSSKIVQLIVNQPNNMLVLAVGLILKNVAQYDEHTCAYTAELYTFLFLLSAHPDSLPILLNSTDLLALSLSLLIPLTSSTHLPTHSKVTVLNSIGRVLHKLSHSTDQFIFKLNKCIRNENIDNAEYKLHYTLMAPVPLLKQYYLNANIASSNKIISNNSIANNNNTSNTNVHKNKISQHPYIQMLCWLLFVWKQNTNILQQIDYIEPLIQCVLHIKQIKSLRLLLCKSAVVQNLAISNHYVNDKYKIWGKSVQQLIYYFNNNNNSNINNINNINNSSNNNSSNNKKSKANNQLVDSHVKNIEQGLAFTLALFSNSSAIKHENESVVHKQTIWNAIKFIDQIYVLVQSQKWQIQSKWKATIKCMFANQTCSKAISACINQGNCVTVNKLVARVSVSINSLADVANQLQLLGSLSCNQSVRSLIVKNRLIEALLNSLIAMDENKVAKLNYGLVYCTASFLFMLSAFKETNAKMVNDRKVVDIWAKVLSLQQSEVVEEKVLQLLTNLSTFKHSKTALMASKDIHKICLGLLSDPQYPHKRSILCVLYNLVYKHAAAIKLYKRKEVQQLLAQLAQVEQLEDMANGLLEVLNDQD